MNLTVEAEGVEETLFAMRGVERELRNPANAEIRAAAKETAGELAEDLRVAAGSSGVPVAARVAQSIKVKSDRFPTVQIGGSTRVGRGGAPAAALVWGSEHGPAGDPNHFAVAPNAGGYWIRPTVERFQESKAPDRFRRAVFEITRRFGLD